MRGITSPKSSVKIIVEFQPEKLVLNEKKREWTSTKWTFWIYD
jgi:hypothetical protein